VALPGFSLRRSSDGFIAICRGSAGAVVAGLAILLDFWHTGLWFSRMQVDPDLSRVAGPTQSYAHVLHDPFGFDGLQTGLRYPGAGRFMAHFTTKVWADYALGWMHVVLADPVRSLYFSLALTAVVVHIGFLVVGCGYLRAYQPMSAKSTIFAAIALSLFVQLASQRFYVGIIDHSMSYTFAYAIPLLVLAAFFLPVYRSLLHRDYVPSLIVSAALVLVAMYLAFSGPLVQPVVALIGVLLVGAQAIRRNRLLVHWRLLPGLVVLAILSAWGMYISQFNSESTTSVTIRTRYSLLRHGLFEVLVQPSSPWPLLLASLVFLYRFVSRSVPGTVRLGLRRHMLAGVGFSVAWLTLLPLGGYRNYRPFVLSSVTLLPVTLIAVYLLVLLLRLALPEGLSEINPVRGSASNRSKATGPPGEGTRGSSLGAVLAFGCPTIILVLLTAGKLTAAPANNACQRATFEQLHDESGLGTSFGESGAVLLIPRTCPILTETVGALDDPDYQQAITKLLVRWRIIAANQTLK
jgi:hypothetical protein